MNLLYTNYDLYGAYTPFGRAWTVHSSGMANGKIGLVYMLLMHQMKWNEGENERGIKLRDAGDV